MTPRRFVLLAALLAFLPSASHAQNFDIFPVSLSGSGVVQEEEGPLKVKFTKEDLVNLARGRALGSTVPANEILALAIDCEGSVVPLLVFDSNNPNTPLAFLGFINVEEQEQVEGPKSAAFASLLEFSTAGNETNGITGGEFMLGGAVTFDVEGGCPVKVSASAIGNLEVFVDGESSSLVLAKAGKLKTLGDPIATIAILF